MARMPVTMGRLKDRGMHLYFKRTRLLLAICTTLVVCLAIAGLSRHHRFQHAYQMLDAELVSLGRTSLFFGRSEKHLAGGANYQQLDFLDARNDAADGRRVDIPRIMHQSWRTTKLEKFQSSWQRSWLHNHPDWTYMFWTDRDNRKLIAEHYSWFLDIYDSLPRNIQRADCARYFYMLKYGGCYFDLDFESLRPIDPLLQNVDVALAYMTTDTSSEIAIPNAFLASAPGHLFWFYVLKQIMKAFEGGRVDKSDAHRVTGPVVLKTAVTQYELTAPLKDLVIFPSSAVYGVDFNWRDDPKMLPIFSVCHAASSTFNSTACKAFFPESYAITYWSGDITWMAGQG